MTNLRDNTPAIEDRFLDLPAGRIFIRSWRPLGHRKNLAPILFFHDSLGSVELWREFPSLLVQATGRRVLAYDRLGFGRSSARHEPPSLDLIAEEAEWIVPHLCSALDLQRVVSCGHSIGGGMVIETAAHHPELVVAAVTIAAQAFVEDRTRAGIEDARRAFSDPATLQRLARYHGEKARWVVDAWTETWLAPGFADWSLARALPRVTCPVLAIHGEKDEYGSKAHPERIADGPSRQMHMLPGTGHVIHRECPQDLARIIGAFLAEVRTQCSIAG